MKRFTALALVALIALGTLPLSACGNATTLARVGAGFKQAAAGFKAEVQSLKAANLLTPEKFTKLDQKANGFITAADSLNTYLNSLPGITNDNKSEITGKIAEATGIVRGLLQNPDLLGLPPDNLGVKILTFADVTLQNVAIVLAGINPPPASFSSIGGDSSVPLDKVKVKTAPIPKGAEKYFK